MTGTLLNPITADLSPEGALPHKSGRPSRARNGNTSVASVAPSTRLRRLFGGWMAAANAYRERQAVWLASHRAAERKLNKKRIYRGPIDDALERAARLRQRRRLKRS